MEEPKICREVAEAEFIRFCEATKLRIKPDKYTSEEISDFNTHKERVIEQIMDGNLVITDKGTARYTINDSPGIDKTLEFRRPTGLDLIEGDKAKAGANVERINRMMASITGEHVALFSKLTMNPDYYACTAIMSLIMGESRPA